MEWVASTLHTTSERGVSSITNADAHNSTASSRLKWRPRRFKWTRPFQRKTKSGFWVCAITFQTHSTCTTSPEVPSRNLQDYRHTRYFLLNRFTKLIPMHIFHDSFQQHSVQELSLAVEVNVQLVKPREGPFRLAKRSVTECLRHNKNQSF